MANEKTKKELNPESKPLFAWKSPDAIQHERNGNWYVVMVVVAMVLAAVLVWQQLWSGALVILFATLFLLLSARVKPKEIACAVFAEGVVVDGKAFEYGEFKSFWISLGELPKLKLQRTGRIAGQIEMPLSDIDIDQVRLYISKHLPQEDDKGEDLVDSINRILRF